MRPLPLGPMHCAHLEDSLIQCELSNSRAQSLNIVSYTCPLYKIGPTLPWIAHCTFLMDSKAISRPCSSHLRNPLRLLFNHFALHSHSAQACLPYLLEFPTMQSLDSHSLAIKNCTLLVPRTTIIVSWLCTLFPIRPLSYPLHTIPS